MPLPPPSLLDTITIAQLIDHLSGLTPNEFQSAARELRRRFGSVFQFSFDASILSYSRTEWSLRIMPNPPNAFITQTAWQVERTQAAGAGASQVFLWNPGPNLTRVYSIIARATVAGNVQLAAINVLPGGGVANNNRPHLDPAIVIAGDVLTGSNNAGAIAVSAIETRGLAVNVDVEFCPFAASGGPSHILEPLTGLVVSTPAIGGLTANFRYDEIPKTGGPAAFTAPPAS